jgi:ribosomal protein L14
VNDTDDRIQTFQEMGYELVTDTNVSVGDKRVASPSKEGTPSKVSVGQGVQAYVMRQKQEFYDEDQKTKQVQVNELESSMKQSAKNEGFYGEIRTS